MTAPPSSGLPELRPCPFCGAAAKISRFELGDGEPVIWVTHIQCDNDENCSVCVDIKHINEAVAVEVWNKRSFQGSSPTPQIAGGEYLDAPLVCAELYQVIGYMALYYGITEHPDVQKALDNASQHKLVHKDLLPWPKQDLPNVFKNGEVT